MMKPRTKQHLNLFLCTILHFAVDLSCVYFMAAVVRPMTVTQESWMFRVVLYNAMAFAFPAVAGLLADLYLQKKNLWMSAAGCALIFAAYVLARHTGAAVFLLGLGNGFFHIGGGIEVMNDAGKSYAAPGIFIASGAMGVFLGNTWGRKFLPLWNVFRLIMLAAALVLVIWSLAVHRMSRGDSGQSVPKRVFTIKEGAAAVAPVMTALFFVVFVRSYYGSIQAYSWKTGFTVGLIFTLCIVGGKAAGGVLADRVGIEKATVVSLGLAAVTALFSMHNAVLGCISIFFFNMTMPLTLSLLTALTPTLPGFAFGLLMLALFLGILPTLLGNIRWLFSGWGLSLLCLISLAVLLWSARWIRRRDADELDEEI